MYCRQLSGLLLRCSRSPQRPAAGCRRLGSGHLHLWPMAHGARQKSRKSCHHQKEAFASGFELSFEFGISAAASTRAVHWCEPKPKTFSGGQFYCAPPARDMYLALWRSSNAHFRDRSSFYPAPSQATYLEWASRTGCQSPNPVITPTAARSLSRSSRAARATRPRVCGRSAVWHRGRAPRWRC